MAVSALLTPSSVEVEPGASVSTEVVVRNTGAVVDEFTIEVLGAARAWTTVSTPVVSLFPGGEGRATLTVAPPRLSSVGAGEVDLVVKVTSIEDPTGSVVEEGIITVRAFTAPSIELVPRTVTGSHRASAELAVDNRGNVATTTQLSATDPDAALTFLVEPAEVVVQPGAAGFALVKVSAVRTFWRGPDRSVSYTVTATTGDGVPLSVGGTFVQRARLPRWLLRALLLALLLLVALFLLWQGVLKPAVRTAAREAAVKQVDKAADKAAQQTATALGATPGGGGSGSGGGAGGGGAGGGGGGSTTTTVAGGSSGTEATAAASTGGDDGRGGTSIDKRIAVSANSGSSANQSWDPAPKGTRFSLTDIVLQNPQGDTGLLRIKRGEEVLLETAVENFRDLDFHYVAAYSFEDQKLTVEVDCRNPDAAKPCKVAASFAGFVKKTA